MSRLVYAVCSAVGFDALAFPSGSPGQLAELARLSAFPLILQHRQWSATTAALQNAELWDELLPSDVQRIRDAQNSLEDDILRGRSAQRALLERQVEVDEAELRRFLLVLNERRIELNGRIVTAVQQQLSHRASASETTASLSLIGSRGSTGSAGLLSTRLPTRSLPLPAARAHNASLHNNSVYGRYKTVAVVVAGASEAAAGGNAGEAEDEGRTLRTRFALSTSDSRPESSASLDSEDEPEQRERQQRPRW